MKSLDTYLRTVMESAPCELGSKTSLRLSEAAYPRPQLQRSDWICLNGPCLHQRGRCVQLVTFPSGPIEVPFARNPRAASATPGFRTVGTSEFDQGEGRVLPTWGRGLSPVCVGQRPLHGRP